MRSASLVLLAFLVALSGYNVVEARTRLLDAEFYTSLAHRLLTQLETAYGLSPGQAEVVQAIYGGDAPTTEAEVSQDRVSGELPPVNEGAFNLLDALLIRQARDGIAPSVEDLLGVGADPNAVSEGSSALFAALQDNDVPVIGALLSGGADTNLPNSGGDTPLLTAIEGGQTGTVEDLLSHGADANLAGSDGTTPLLAALQSNATDIVSLLLDHGADVNLAGPDGNTPFQTLLASSPTPEWVQTFLGKGADVSTPNADGLTPLDLAAGDPEIEDLLIAAGASLGPAVE